MYCMYKFRVEICPNYFEMDYTLLIGASLNPSISIKCPKLVMNLSQFSIMTSSDL